MSSSGYSAARSYFREVLVSALEHLSGCPDAPSAASLTDAMTEAAAAIAESYVPAAAAASLGGKKVRVYIDGCFDLVHAGHYNALRQARSLGDELVVGIHSSEEICRNKGPPVMTDEERVAAVKACKWVDEVAFGTPYVPSVRLLDELNCDFVVHGDDLATSPDGSDVYDEVRNAGRMRVVKRSTGISTTDLVGRLLLMTKEHHVRGADAQAASSSRASDFAEEERGGQIERSAFLTTTWRIAEFSNRVRPKASDSIVYVDGVFDLFHVGHIKLLEEAKKMGSFVYVGIHDDQTVNKHRGRNHPIMNLHERCLSVLACKWVDDVVIGAPWAPTQDLLVTLNVDKVICGSPSKLKQSEDPYIEVRSTGKYVPFWSCEKDGGHKSFEVTNGSSDEYVGHDFLSTDEIIQRIIDNHLKFKERQAKKSGKDKEYNQNKVYVAEV